MTNKPQILSLLNKAEQATSREEARKILAEISRIESLESLWQTYSR